MSSDLFTKELARLDRHLDAGIITEAAYRDGVAEAKARYGNGGTQPPTTSTTATAASAAPRRTTKEAIAARKDGEKPAKPKGKAKWDPMPLPEPLDQEGNPIEDGLSVITVRAIEGPKKKFKKGEKWEGSGLPNGKIGIGTGFRNELTMTVVQFLEFHAVMEKIYDAVMGSTDKDGNEVPGIVDDSQPREVLVL